MKILAHVPRKVAGIGCGLALLAIGGCAAMPDSGGGAIQALATCSSNPCAATVTVTVQGNRCMPHTNPQQLDIPAGNTNDIVWTIPGGNFKFAHNGVEFKSGSGAGFSNGGGGGGQSFRYHNNHPRPGVLHHYNVTVTDGTLTCTEDPTILNR